MATKVAALSILSFRIAVDFFTAFVSDFQSSLKGKGKQNEAARSVYRLGYISSTYRTRSHQSLNFNKPTMILPEDTKAPVSSDDEGDFYEPHTTYVGAVNDDQYPRGSSPTHSSLSLPLFLAQEEGIELGPAPPYSSHDEHLDMLRGLARKRAKAKKWMASRRAAFWSCVGVVGTLLVLAIFAPRPQLRRDRPFWGDGGRPPSGDANVKNLACASFDEKGWKEFNYDLPHPPARVPDNEGVLYSQNVSFLVPIDSPEEVFSHLVGPHGIGSIFVETYDPSEEALEEDKKGAILPPDSLGRKLSSGEYIRAIVEPMILVSPDEDGIEQSEALERLRMADVCLMERHDNGTSYPPPPPDDEGGEMPPPPMEVRHIGRPRDPKDGLGVGVYTKREDDSSDKGTPRLQFRIHLFVPLASDSTSARAQASITDSILSALSMSSFKGKEEKRQGFIHSLEILGGAGTAYLGDLTGAGFGQLALDLAVGQISTTHVRAGSLWMKTTGEIRGSVAVENSLFVDAPVGEVNVNVTIATPSKFASEHSDLVNTSEETRSSKPQSACDLPPVLVNARTGSGSLKLAYVGWEDSCRTLSQDIFSLVGSVYVRSHPAFQGPVNIASSIGKIDVEVLEDVEDPSGQGRQRQVKLQKHSTLGSASYIGSVKWADPSDDDEYERENGDEGDEYEEDEYDYDDEEGDEAEEDEDEEAGEERLRKREAGPPGPPRKGKSSTPGLEVRTSVGTVHVVV